MSIKTELQDALAYVNTKLTAKGAQAAMTIYGIGDRIESITGGGVSPSAVTYDQRNDQAKAFVEGTNASDERTNGVYDSSDYDYSAIALYAPEAAVSANWKPKSTTLTVNQAGTLILSERASGRTKRVGVSEGKVTVSNITPGVTDYFIIDSNNVLRQYGTINASGALRMIDNPGTVPNGGVSGETTNKNIRDLGGWACDGGTVKYGKLFRGGQPFSADEDVLVNQLGIKTFLNLRGTDNGGVWKDAWATFGGTKTVGPVPMCAYQLDTGVNTAAIWNLLIRTVFDAVNYNEPLYFHCQAGADRTGTLACIIEALLGISQSDIDKDYELTTFATGSGTDANARRRNETDWKNLITAINGLSHGSTFRDKVANWVASMGFSAAEINTFRRIMIDGNPADIVLDNDIDIRLQGIDVTLSSNRAFPESTVTASAVLTPSNTTQDGIAWSVVSGDATITQDGVVTLGTTMSTSEDKQVVIRASSDEDSTIYGEATITVPQNLYSMDTTDHAKNNTANGLNQYYSVSNKAYSKALGYICALPVSFVQSTTRTLQVKGFYKRDQGYPCLVYVIYLDENNEYVGHLTVPNNAAVTDYSLSIGSATAFATGKDINDIAKFFVSVKISNVAITQNDVVGSDYQHYIAWT